MSRAGAELRLKQSRSITNAWLKYSLSVRLGLTESVIGVCENTPQLLAVRAMFGLELRAHADCPVAGAE